MLKFMIILHVFLVPYTLYVLNDDAAHPERCDTWYRNPDMAIPYCLVMEAVIWGGSYHLSRQERRQEGIKLLEKAIELRRRGRHREADRAYEQGCKLCGIR